MRAAWLTLATLAVIGCGRVDSNRTTSLDDHVAPAPVDRTPARPTTTVTDHPAAPATSAPAVTEPKGTGPATAGVGRPAREDLAAGEPAVRDNTVRENTVRDSTVRDSTVRADNTAVNERDRHAAAKTPLDQGENEADRTTTANIRQRIVNAENMSINARNVKIITAGGKVTLRGPVNSAAEREAIVKFARDVAGEGNVEDHLEVASSNP